MTIAHAPERERGDIRLGTVAYTAMDYIPNVKLVTE